MSSTRSSAAPRGPLGIAIGAHGNLPNGVVTLESHGDIMHHKDPRTTRIYTEVDSEVIAKVGERRLGQGARLPSRG